MGMTAEEGWVDVAVVAAHLSVNPYIVGSTNRAFLQHS